MSLRNIAAKIYKSGVKKVAKKFSTPAAVLIYHRVVNLAMDNQLLAVSPKNFEAQLEILKLEYNVLAIDEFLHYLNKAKGFPPRSVLITFDDGYYDNYTHALPLLEAAGMQSLFYVATSHIGTDKEFWWDLLEKIFFKTSKLPPTLKIQFHDGPLNFNTVSAADKFRTYQQLHLRIKYLTTILRDEKIQELLNWAGIENGDSLNRVMKEEELVRFSKSDSVLIGAHTHSHPALVSLGYKDQYQEINRSKKILEDLTGREIKHFSYPFGTKFDYDANSLKIVKEFKFDLVCSNFSNLSYSWTSKYEVPRLLVRDWGKAQFKKRMEEFFN